MMTRLTVVFVMTCVLLACKTGGDKATADPRREAARTGDPAAVPLRGAVPPGAVAAAPQPGSPSAAPGAAAVGTSAPAVGTATTADEQEPNDDVKTATPLALETAMRATLKAAPGAKKSDEDWFKVTTADEKGILSVEVTGVPGMKLGVELFDAQKRLIASAVGSVGEAVVFPNLGVKKGDSYVRVRERTRGKAAVESDTPYTITATTATRLETEEVEPNNRAVDATPLEEGKTMSGFMSPRGDEDWWKIVLPESKGDKEKGDKGADKAGASFLRVSVKGVATGDGRVAIVDSIGAKVTEQALKAGGEVVFPNVGIKEGSKQMHVVVKTVGLGSAKERYEVTAKVEKSTGDMEIEPNDSDKHATPLTVGKPIRGFMASAKDVDWYSFKVTEPSVARIELGGVERVDHALEVVGARGEKLARSDDGRAKESETVTNVFLPVGEAFVRVSSARKGGENIDETYELAVTLRAAPDDEEREPNNGDKQANELSSGKTLLGYIHPKKDRDFYQFVLREEKKVVVSVIGIAKVGLAVSLVDEKGAIVADGRGPAGGDVAFDKKIPAGTYRVVVEQNLQPAKGKKGKPRTESNPRDPYKLTLKVEL
ncbi:MAG: hypothetical protein HYY84_17030 [Deltaproteobacteria bacterium]|nr:hypothetical protein [Deltaproteobacteria bacterium]